MNWDGQPLVLAARAMRRTVADQARGTPDAATVLKTDRALDSLAEKSPRQAVVAELRLFTRASEEESAAALGISVRTFRRDWTMARVALYNEQ